MSIKKRSGPVRQLSLPQSSQRCLQKRSSVDLSDSKSEKDTNNNNIKKKTGGDTASKDADINLLISASSISKQNGDVGGACKKSQLKGRNANGPAKGRGAWVPPLRPVRLAWGERGQAQSQSQEGGSGVQVVAERCKGQSRPQTAGPPSRENALGYNRNTLLYSRKQFAERIRQAWRDREFTKPNLEIFLASPANPDGLAEPRLSPRTRTTAPKYDYNVFSTNERSTGSSGRSGSRGPGSDGRPEYPLEPRSFPSCATPYSILSNEAGSELGRTRMAAPSEESELGGRATWESELGSNFISDSVSSDDEDDGPIPTPFLQQRISSYDESGKMYKAETHPRNGTRRTSTSESSSFESTDGTEAWANGGTPISASTRRQNFRNASQKAIDKSGSRSTPPVSSTPQPQSTRTARKVSTPPAPAQGPPAILAPGNPPRIPKPAPTPITKRLWSVPVPSQSFDAPSSEPSSYRGYERNIKSAPPPKRRLKAVRRKLKPFYGNLSASDDETGGKGTLGRRRTTFLSGPKEVETMISLLSPTDSETEADGPDHLALLQVNDGGPLSPSILTQPPPQHYPQGVAESTTAKSIEPKPSREDIREIKPPPMLFLRKSPKPVSFKLLGSTAKTHTALYPCRRSEPPTFENGARDALLHTLKIQPPSTRLEMIETRIDQKKLVRAKTTELSGLDGGETERSGGMKVKDSERLHSILIAEVSPSKKATETSGGESSHLSLASPPAEAPAASATSSDTDTAPDSSQPEFKTTKERECWELFRKMLDKGVSVSFDTVLRGMLTPTEYRLRKVSEDTVH